MTDETALNKRISRKARAEVLLRDELLLEAFDTLHREYEKAWRNTKDNETAERERLFMAVKTVGLVKGHLLKAVDDGNLAQKEIDAAMGRKPKIFGVI